MFGYRSNPVICLQLNIKYFALTNIIFKKSFLDTSEIDFFPVYISYNYIQFFKTKVICV